MGQRRGPRRGGRGGRPTAKNLDRIPLGGARYLPRALPPPCAVHGQRLPFRWYIGTPHRAPPRRRGTHVTRSPPRCGLPSAVRGRIDGQTTVPPADPRAGGAFPRAHWQAEGAIFLSSSHDVCVCAGGCGYHRCTGSTLTARRTAKCGARQDVYIRIGPHDYRGPVGSRLAGLGTPRARWVAHARRRRGMSQPPACTTVPHAALGAAYKAGGG